MPGASFSAELPLAIRARLIVEHEEVVVLPSCCIVANHSDEAEAIVILDRHEENAIILGPIGRASFFFQLGRPALTFITVGTFVGLFAPGVSELDQALIIRQFFGGKDNIRVTSRQTAAILFATTGPDRRIKEDHFAVLVMEDQLVPDRVNVKLVVHLVE